MERNNKIINILKKHHVNFFMRNKNNYCLYEFINNDLELFVECLKNNIINQAYLDSTANGETILMRAVRKNNITLVDTILNMEPNLLITNCFKKTVINICVDYLNLSDNISINIFKKLIDYYQKHYGNFDMNLKISEKYHQKCYQEFIDNIINKNINHEMEEIELD